MSTIGVELDEGVPADVGLLKASLAHKHWHEYNDTTLVNILRLPPVTHVKIQGAGR